MILHLRQFDLEYVVTSTNQHLIGIVLFQFPDFPHIMLYQPTIVLEALQVHLETWAGYVNKITESFVLLLQAHLLYAQRSALIADDLGLSLGSMQW